MRETETVRNTSMRMHGRVVYRMTWRMSQLVEPVSGRIQRETFRKEIFVLLFSFSALTGSRSPLIDQGSLL